MNKDFFNIFFSYFAGTLTIDNSVTVTGVSPPSSESVNHIDRLYFGGVPNGSLIPSKIPVRLLYFYKIVPQVICLLSESGERNIPVLQLHFELN